MFIVVFVVAVFGVTVNEIAAIKNLAGEPDYRQVILHWEDENEIGEEYQVRYCELQTWGTQKCRNRKVADEEKQLIDGSSTYNVEVKNLRMATTYSFEIKKDKDQDERKERAESHNQNVIVIPTKGFSAKATQCLPHASEIEVSTGPFFGGRIAVEAADGERCALDGEPNSPRDTYTLRINHTECGSKVNETTVATFVIVQENLPILTHSTRRFLVLCSYQPETLTVRAGLNLPTGHARGQASISSETFEENAIGRRGRHARMGRLLLKPEALVKDEDAALEPPQSNLLPVLVIVMLSIAAAIGLIALALKITQRRLLDNLDGVSIASDLSITSTTTEIAPQE